ncbi:MAG: transcription elongation factor GreB [Halothiobacillaceae bacterium]
MFPSKYITPEGYARLKKELDDLWRVQRPKVVQAVAEAAALGDRSENAEYIYGKKMLREIDRRVRYLRKRLDGMVVVSSPPSDTRKIFFGAWVRLEDEDGQELEVRIVGPDEFDPKRNWISLDSPMARALMRRSEGDEVAVPTPSGVRHFLILGIRYQAEPD